MLRKIKREELPIRFKISSGDHDKGIVIGNTVIFNAIYRKEVKQIKAIYKHGKDTHGFYVHYKNDPVLHIIYLRE